ncbi:OLC1v1007740C1 [Oldenlandia corymbosa var. corymbosa]|uniref:OLC1v1007740C1 n=1 Tax=Oldenlandia corymbosa var. corymbosa TaxID=529605 RepID=A0AAV1DJZ5_OLDCO|nr:OLC1v1007740C1 [Oldenlandia corymbosa var. corymbosa]
MGDSTEEAAFFYNHSSNILMNPLFSDILNIPYASDSSDKSSLTKVVENMGNLTLQHVQEGVHGTNTSIFAQRHNESSQVVQTQTQGAYKGKRIAVDWEQGPSRKNAKPNSDDIIHEIQKRRKHPVVIKNTRVGGGKQISTLVAAMGPKQTLQSKRKATHHIEEEKSVSKASAVIKSSTKRQKHLS